MFKVLNQFRRMVYDDGRNDRTFLEQEIKLKAAQGKVVTASARLVKASEGLNEAALRAYAVDDQEPH